MNGYKYPWLWSTAQTHRAATRRVEDELHRGHRRFKMLSSRCMLPLLALYFLLEQISGAVLPSGLRNKREMNWLDREVFSRLSDPSDVADLSVGDAGETSRDRRLESLVDSKERVTVQHQIQNQYQRNHKANEKRRKVAPMDSIGRFQMSSFRNRKDEPDMDREDHIN